MSNKDPLIELVTPKTKWYVVLRPFTGSTETFVRGQVLDTDKWKHTVTLELRRYIARLPQGAPVPKEEMQADGVLRRIITASKKKTDK